MAALVRAYSWRVTPLGAIENWPQALKTAIDIMLHSRQPAYVVWGPSLTTFYNDAAITILGSWHPRGLGRPYSEIWEDNWSELRPVVEATLAGEAQHVVGQRARPASQDAPASWYTYSWMPLRNDKGHVAGFYCVATETILKLGDEQLRTILENTHDAISMQDLQSGKYLFISPSHTPLTGFSTEEIREFTRKDFWDRLHPEDRERANLPPDDKAGSGPETSTEYRWRIKSGEYRWFSVSRKLVREPTGKPVAVVNVSRDITDRKRAELEVQASQAKLQAALTSMTDAVYIADTQGRLIQVNEAFATFHRFDSIESCPKSVQEFPALFDASLPNGEPVPLEIRPIPRALRGEKSVATELKLRRKDTGESWIGSYSFAPIRDAQGQIMGAVVTARDVTEAKKAEANLRSSEARYRVLHESLRDGFVQTTMDGIIVDCNDIFCEIVGYSRDELRALTYIDLTLERWRAVQAAIVKYEVLERGYSGVYEKEYRRKDGSVVPVELRTTLSCDESGVPNSMWALVRDISERKSNEARLQSLKEQLMHVGRVQELGQVSAGIAHELNQPLAAVHNYSATAKRLIARNDPASISAAAQVIAKAGEQAARAGEIIRRMRDFVEKGDADHKSNDVNQMVDEAAALGLIGAKADGIEAHFILAPDLPSVRADRVQIEQVIVNLLHNAMDAMAHSSKRQLTLSTRHHLGTVEIAVADSGPGIPEAVVERLFQPFVTTKPNGMGIGLAISRNIVEAHSGEITVEHNPGGGAIFRVRLPAAGDLKSVSL